MDGDRVIPDANSRQGNGEFLSARDDAERTGSAAAAMRELTVNGSCYESARPPACGGGRVDANIPHLVCNIYDRFRGICRLNIVGPELDRLSRA